MLAGGLVLSSGSYPGPIGSIPLPAILVLYDLLPYSQRIAD